MKRNIIYVMTLLLPLLMGCKQGSNAATDTDAADSLAIDTLQTTEDAQLSTLNSQQIDVEKYWAQFQEMYEEEDLDDIHETLTKYYIENGKYMIDTGLSVKSYPSTECNKEFKPDNRS